MSLSDGMQAESKTQVAQKYAPTVQLCLQLLHQVQVLFEASQCKQVVPA